MILQRAFIEFKPVQLYGGLAIAIFTKSGILVGPGIGKGVLFSYKMRKTIAPARGKTPDF